MPKLPIPFQIDPMQLADIPQVVAVEQAAYTMQWSPRAYEYELTQNKLAHYFVLRATAPQPPLLIGLGGFWLMADEAHISTIAVAPNRRRQGLGEWLLIALLEEAQRLAAAVATLEVRPSNKAARSLYQKYRFQEVGRRPRYYPDNNEDALILTSSPLSTPDYHVLLAQHKTLLRKRLNKTKI